MSEVREEIDIAAPPEEVWALVMDPARLGEWVTIHRKLFKHSDGAPAVGSTMEQGMTLRGAHFKVKWELVTCRAPTHAEWHGKGPARSHAETEYTLKDNGNGGTRFSYRNVFEAPFGPLGAAASKVLVGGLPHKEAVRSLQNLKRLLEG
jgi:carbon monoxide dehydrogenase subunit G